jgi:hypothetical protein
MTLERECDFHCLFDGDGDVEGRCCYVVGLLSVGGSVRKAVIFMCFDWCLITSDESSVWLSISGAAHKMVILFYIMFFWCNRNFFQISVISFVLPLIVQSSKERIFSTRK